MDNDKVFTCRKCEVVWGCVGIFAALTLAVIGADLLSGGKLTRLISGENDDDQS
jgi:hypothetical protein